MRVNCTRYLQKSVVSYLRDKMGIKFKQRKFIIEAIFGEQVMAHAKDSIQFTSKQKKVKKDTNGRNETVMFNMRALGYTAHIKTVVHFLANLNKHIGINFSVWYVGLLSKFFPRFTLSICPQKLFLSNSKTQNAFSFLLKNILSK